jgi:chitodextrinase
VASPVGQTGNTAFVDRSVTRGAQYVYTVAAADAAGNVSQPRNAVGMAIP